MSDMLKNFPSIKSVPAELVHRWKLVSPPPQDIYIRFGGGGEYLVSQSQMSFAVAPDGQTLNWANAVWNRHYGTGQTLIGVWRTGLAPNLEEMYFRDDGTTWYTDTTNVAVGIFSILTPGFASGDMIYEERRGTATASGNQIVVNTIFGGRYEMLYSLSNGDQTLTIESPIGNFFVYERV